MAKTLGEIARSYQDNNDQGNFEEYRNRKGKVLPGYNPTVGGDKAQYLSETPGESEQFLEAEMSDAEKQEKDDEELTESRTEEYDKSLQKNVTITERVYETPDDVERERRILRQNREALLSMEERHKRLNEKLDAAINAEYQRRKDLRAIENEKKNTLDYAYKVYGDQADVEAIFDSASDAKRQASPEIHSLSEQISFGIDNKLHQKDQVTVVTETGHVRIMDRELAEAMEVYTQKQRTPTLLERIASGIQTTSRQLDQERSVTTETETKLESLESEDYDRYIHEDFEFTRDEEEKLAELQNAIRDTDKQVADFEQKTPQTMTPEEYAEYNRERRFKEYGYPDANVNYDYELTREGMYTYNGRQLPSAMSSPTMQRELQAERQPQMDQPTA